MEFVRGDTFAFKFKITTQDNEDISINDIDTLFITCRKKTHKDSPIIFQKTISDVTIEDGYCHAVFNPQDTETLKLGLYYFDIEITLNSGYRKTKLFEFTITAETTMHGGDGSGN